MASAKFQIERKCEICGKSFIAKTLTSRYCSKNCSQAAYKQRKKEEREKKTEKKDFILMIKKKVKVYSMMKKEILLKLKFIKMV